MTKRGCRRFESEVHLGLLVIVCILLFLNFTSNFIIYRAREANRKSATATLNTAALSVARIVRSMVPPSLTESQKHKLMRQYGLSGLIVIPSKPPDESAESRKKWFASIVQNLPPGQIPDIARKLLASDFRTLTRGGGDEYFYVYPVPSDSRRSLVILSKNVPELAYLDHSGQVVLVVGIVSVLAIAGMYLLLSRFIFSPFRRIRKEALDAGRVVDQKADDIEAVVDDYRSIIDELKDKETKLRRLHEAVRRRADSLEQFNQHLLTSISSGIVTVDKQGQILSINRAAAEVLAVEPADFEERSYHELLKPYSELTQAVRQTLTKGKNVDYREIGLTVRDGKSRTLGVSVSVISDGLHEPIGASILINDLTELQQLRTELETKNRLAALGEMSGGLAHQLRNSMAAISGYCNLLKKRLKKSGVELGSVSALVQETAETEKLVERFLQFAKPLTLTLQPVSIHRLVAQVIETLQTQPGCRQARFVIKQGDDVMMELDPLLTKQALTNIIENAVNAYEDRTGLVEIRMSMGAPPLEGRTSQEAFSSKPAASKGVPSPGLLQIEIEDFGCGIARENLDKIFTPFFSLRPSGTGLGLPLARKIIDLHHGALAVTSRLGKGTTFAISLPVRSDFGDVGRHRPTPGCDESDTQSEAVPRVSH